MVGDPLILQPGRPPDSRPTTLFVRKECAAKYRARQETTLQHEIRERSEGKLGKGGRKQETNADIKSRIKAEKERTIKQNNI